MDIKKLTRQEIADMLPDRFMLSFGGDFRDRHKYMIGKRDSHEWHCTAFEEYSRTCSFDAQLLEWKHLIGWLINGDLIDGMKLDQFLDSIADTDLVNIDFSTMSTLL